MEVAPEIRQQLLPVQLAFRHLVELVFEAGGEVVLDIMPEEVREERSDQLPPVLGYEARLIHAYIVAIAQDL
jgi:hypothetical protein